MKRTEIKPPYHKIPMCFLRRLALQFRLGEGIYDDPAEVGKLDGKMNWQDATPAELTDAWNHAIEHLLLSKTDRSEDHLAAVAWYCSAAMYHQEKDGNPDKENKAKILTGDWKINSDLPKPRILKDVRGRDRRRAPKAS